MILALGKDDGSLHLFASLAEAESHFEAINIENCEYEFCDDTGQRFAPEIVAPITAFRAGSYRLRQTGTQDPALVSSFISRAHYLVRGCEGVQCLDDLKGT